MAWAVRRTAPGRRVDADGTSRPRATRRVSRSRPRASIAQFAASGVALAMVRCVVARHGPHPLTQEASRGRLRHRVGDGAGLPRKRGVRWAMASGSTAHERSPGIGVTTRPIPEELDGLATNSARRAGSPGPQLPGLHQHRVVGRTPSIPTWAPWMTDVARQARSRPRRPPELADDISVRRGRPLLGCARAGARMTEAQAVVEVEHRRLWSSGPGITG